MNTDQRKELSQRASALIECGLVRCNPAYALLELEATVEAMLSQVAPLGEAGK